ncbi:MAG: MFS transporter [Acidimicrobiia bacterium]|nr:MAG: MFS transporter [Acidimicrobiia bacterium]
MSLFLLVRFAGSATDSAATLFPTQLEPDRVHTSFTNTGFVDGTATLAFSTISTASMTSPLQPQDPRAFTPRDRRVLFLTSIIGFVTGYAGSQMAHTLPFARATFELTEGQMSAIFATVRAVSLLGVLFAMSADRNGRRKPLLAAFALLAFGSLATAFVPSIAAYVISQSAVRVALVAIAALSIVLIAEELHPEVRAFGIGIYGLAGSMGVGLGLLLLPIAEANDNAWRILFGFATLGLLAFPLLSRFLPESRAFTPATPIPFFKALGMGLSRHFWPLAGISFFVAAFSSPAFDFVLERLINGLSWETGAARFLLIVFSGLGAVGLLVGGRLADRYGRRPTSVAALAIGLVGGIGFYTLDSGWFLAASIFLATLGATMLAPSFAAQRSELFPTRVRATATAWLTNVAIIGSISGFATGAVLIDTVGIAVTISALGAGLVIAIVLVLRLPETQGMDLVRKKAVHSDATRQAPPVA